MAKVKEKKMDDWRRGKRGHFLYFSRESKPKEPGGGGPEKKNGCVISEAFSVANDMHLCELKKNRFYE